MSFYIVFDNLASLLEASRTANLAEAVEKSVSDSVETANSSEVSEVSQVTILADSDGKVLLKVDSPEDATSSAIDYDKGTAALLSKIPIAVAPKDEQLLLPKIETEIFSHNGNTEGLQPAFENLEVSLRYRIDYTDIFRSRQKIENSESIGNLTEENLKKARTGQEQQAEIKFQEKQTENFKESFKQKRFAAQLQK